MRSFSHASRLVHTQHTQVDPFVEKQRGFLRDVATAVDSIQAASAAVASAPTFENEFIGIDSSLGIPNPFKAAENVVNNAWQDTTNAVSHATKTVTNEVINPVGEAAIGAVNEADRAISSAANEVGNAIEQVPAVVSDQADKAIDEAQRVSNEARSIVSQAQRAAMDGAEEAVVTTVKASADLAKKEAEKALADANKAVEEAAKIVDAELKEAAMQVANAALTAANAAMDAAEEAIVACEEAAEEVNDAAIAISKTVQAELVDKILLPLATGVAEFLGVLDEVIAVIFETIGQAIFEFYKLEELDIVVKAVLAGGIANFKDIILGRNFMKEMIDEVTYIFKQVEPFIDIIKEGLDTIGALDFIDYIFNPGSRASLASSSYNDEYIKISDGNGNYGYLTSDEHDLLAGGGGLKDLMTKLQNHALVQRVNAVQNSIEELVNTLTESSPSDALDEVINAVKELVLAAADDFRNFLQKVDSMGSIQFLVTAEVDMIAGAGFEIGVSIDVRQLLYFIMHEGNWDPQRTQVASLHVGYAIDGQYNPWCHLLSIHQCLLI